MKDRIPLYPGRVKLTPVAGQENTYDMVRADQPTQEGDPLNKGTLLSDYVAELFGLSTDAVPNDVFSVLSRLHSKLGNEYVWEKLRYTYEILYEQPSNNFVYQSSINSTVTYYTDILVENSQIVLSGAVTIKLTSLSTAKSLVGKYITGNAGVSVGEIVRIDSVQQASTNLNFFGSIAVVSTKKESYGYINSPNKNAYPPTEPDEYTYVGPKQIGSFASIETGTYVGTGTENRSISFSFTPDIWGVYAVKSSGDSIELSSLGNTIPWGIDGPMYMCVTTGVSTVSASVVYSGNSVTVWGPPNQAHNYQGYTYYYYGMKVG